MKLTLRPEWRLRPLSSCLGLLDIKTGVTVALLFAVCAPVHSWIFTDAQFAYTLGVVASGVEQGRGCLRSHCCSDRSRRFCGTAQHVSLLRYWTHSSRMGTTSNFSGALPPCGSSCTAILTFVRPIGGRQTFIVFRTRILR